MNKQYKIVAIMNFDQVQMIENSNVCAGTAPS